MKGAVFTHILGTQWGRDGMRWSSKEVFFCKKAAQAPCPTVIVIRFVCVCSDRAPEQVDQEADLYVWKLLGSDQKSMCL